ncbi:hypothetical protein EHP00_67 [Ecytonucleospora hepatopenaei]|uniref:Uncharacterized protein n=1 Tax=Ecytonucleospora hepatopenaei TaxID=646526 RepID=A0A1W0E5U6_9MICR|nr:hypothetical protein EHP00_67 [Ecytonucleospora hepatopenaei]
MSENNIFKDEELANLLQELSICEEKQKELECKYVNVLAHKKTIIRSLFGKEFHFFSTPVIEKNKETIFNFNNSSLFLINKPSKGEPLGTGNLDFFLSKYANYKAIRIFYANKKQTLDTKYEVYTTSVIKKNNSYKLEISDTENNVWTDFNMFMNEFTHLNVKCSISQWFGL